jgi:hypothetical protein
MPDLNKNIAGYLPYGLRGKYEDEENPKYCSLITIGVSHIPGQKLEWLTYGEDLIPVLYPESDLYKPRIRNGKEIVPIIELSKIGCPEITWDKCEDTYALGDNGACSFVFENGGFSMSYINDPYMDDIEEGTVENHLQLFDFMNELLIDYRGLIKSGLAVDVHTLKNNPYIRNK